MSALSPCRTVAVGILAVLTVSTPSAFAAPGRVAIAVVPEIASTHKEVYRANAVSAVALADGGAIVVAGRARGGFAAMRLRADGSLHRAFGSAGVARVAIAGGPFDAEQVLVQPDGRLLVAVTSRAIARYENPRLSVVRLTPGGAVDTSFGRRGIAATGVQRSCGGCDTNAPIGLAPDGTVVVAGHTGADTDRSPQRAVVVRLTRAGALDSSFGVHGAVRPPGERAVAAAVSPSGRIVVVVDHTRLVALTPAGLADPSFNAGAPFELSMWLFGGSSLYLHPDGTIDLQGINVFRFTPAGVLDPSYGRPLMEEDPFGGPRRVVADSPVGIAQGPFLHGAITRMEPLPDGSTLIYAPNPTSDEPLLTVRRISADGVAGLEANLSSTFGGGAANGRRLRQNSFEPSLLLRRPDGSFLVIGAVHVLGRADVGTGLLAAAAYTPALQPDPSFGGSRTPVRASVRVPRQTTRAAVKLQAVRVRLTASGPGLALVRVRDGRQRIVARSIVPVYRAGTSTVNIRVEWAGLELLRAQRELRVQVGYEFRDVFTETDEGAVVARLR